MNKKNLKQIILCFILSVFIISCNKKDESVETSDCAIFRANLQRTGLSSSPVNQDLVDLKWIYTSLGKIQSSPAIVENMVFFGSDKIEIMGRPMGGYLHALDMKTGEEIWKFQCNLGVNCSPAVFNKTIYFGSDGIKRSLNDIIESYFYAVDMYTGQEKWKFKSEYHEINSSPAIFNNTVVFGSGKCLYALDINSGLEKWRFNTNISHNIWSSPAIADSTVYFNVGNQNYLFAVNINTGQEKWRLETKEFLFYGISIANNTLFFGGRETIYAVDMSTGLEKWTFETEDEYIQGTPAITNSIVFFAKGEYMYAVDINTGHEKWKYKANTRVGSSPSIADGLVLFGTDCLYALDLHTGEEKWKYKFENYITTEPVIANGIIFWGADKNLYAIE